MQARAVSPISCGSTGTSRQKSTGTPCLGTAFFKYAAGARDALLALGKEHHGRAVVAFRGKDLPALLRLLAEEVVRYLKEHARTVPGILLEARSAAMLEIDEDRERVIGVSDGTSRR